jgi:hypothetical protein
MTPQEIFSIEVDPDCITRERCLDIYSNYWALEMELAGEMGVAYCDLEECDIDTRTCATCGTVNHTDQWGSITRECQNDKCQMARSYWGIVGYIYQFTHIGGDKLRAAWLRTRIDKMFGEKKLSAIPEEIRLEFLLSAMIERMTFEDRKNDAGIA